MRRIFVYLALIASLMMAAIPASAQTDATAEATAEAEAVVVDIESAAEAALDADLDTLITDMEEPMAEADLPEVFSDPEYIDPETATEEDLVLPADDLDFAEGSVAYNVSYDPDVSGMAIGFSSLNYIFVDGEITEEDLEDFRDGAAEGLAEDGSGAEVSVEDIEYNGVPGVLISYELEEDDIISIVQMIAVPVGNTMVLSMVVLASDDLTIDANFVRGDAEALLGAGIVHLGEVAEGAQ